MLVSLMVPCYNEQEALPFLYEALCKVMEECSQYDYELIFVNDGSRDKTLSVLKDMAAKDSRVRYISFSRNFGKEAAMYAGLSAAKGEWIGLLDADMQDPPSLLPQMFQSLENDECDIIATRRVSRKGEPPIRSWFARRFYHLINRFTDVEIVDGARDFRVMRRPVVDAILSLGERQRFSKGIFAWVGFRTKRTSSVSPARRNGPSGSSSVTRSRASFPLRPHRCVWPQWSASLPPSAHSSTYSTTSSMRSSTASGIRSPVIRPFCPSCSSWAVWSSWPSVSSANTSPRPISKSSAALSMSSQRTI